MKTTASTIVKLQNVKLNRSYQIRFKLASGTEYILSIENLLNYKAYMQLLDIGIFLSASFDDDLIFWQGDCDIHIDQLLALASPYTENEQDEWISARKTSYYDYTIHNWTFN